MGLLSRGQWPVASSCLGLCVLVARGNPESEGSGAHKGAGSRGRASMARVPPEWFPVAIVSALPGLLGGSLSRGFWRGGWAEEGVLLTKGTQECVTGGKEEGGGESHPWERRDVKNP